MLARVRYVALGTIAASAVLAISSGAAGAKAPKPKTAARARAAAPPAWELRGSRIIACCCASPCPCRLNKPPMNCHGSDSTTAVRIEKGHLGKTRMDGVTFAVIGRAFAEKPEENWSYAYVSDQATAEQVQALKGMLEQSIQGYGAKTKYLAGRFLGLRQVPLAYRISADRREHSAAIPGILELKTRSIILPGHKQPAISTGIFDDFGDRFIHADCLAHTYHDQEIGYEWELTGRQSNQADFVLNPERLARGGIGWGCWSAHAELGSKDDYQERLIGHDTKKSCCEKK